MAVIGLGRKCAVCDGTVGVVLFRQRFGHLTGVSGINGYDVVACRDCGFGFAEDVPDQQALDIYYQELSKYERQDYQGKDSEHDVARFKAIATAIARFLPGTSSRLLDVGCANGGLLASLKELGYGSVIGLDPSPHSAEVAQAMHGVRVVTGSLGQLPRALRDDAAFDCVILIGVLEHIRDLGQALDTVGTLVRTGGIVYAEVPDATAFRNCPDAPFQQFSTEHINFFSSVSMANLMARHGFPVLVVERAKRAQSSSTVMPVLTGAFLKKDGMPVPIVPRRDANTRPALLKYIEQSRQMEKRIQQTLDELVNSQLPILVWGTGTHTLRLLATTNLCQAQIRAFVDSNPHYQGRKLDGRPVISPADVRGLSEPILVSSRVFQLEIQRQIKDRLGFSNQVILLYDV